MKSHSGKGKMVGPSRMDSLADVVFRKAAFMCALALFSLVAFLFLAIGYEAAPAYDAFGLSFITGSTWDSGREIFGILPEIWGTLYSSLLALLLGGFLGISVAILLTQGFLPDSVSVVLRNTIELLAAIPSVVYGLWGLYVVIPFLYNDVLVYLPFETAPIPRPGLAPAVVVLAIMILPTVAAISIDALQRIPSKTYEAVYGMGTTRFEAITKVVLPTASSGLLAALVLAFGRALGETMALAMLIGNANQISLSLLAPANTLASLMASTFPEAGELELQALMYAGIVLLLITFVVNVVGMWIQVLTSRKFEGAR